MIKIGHTDEQFAITHLELEDKPKFVVTLDIVDHLYDRSIVLARIVEHHGVARLDNREPLPVGMHLSGETTEDGMLWIAEDTKGARRDGLLVVL